MSKFKFSEKERENIRSVIRSDADWEGVFDRIEQIVSERDGWIDVNEAKPPLSSRIIVHKRNGLVCEMYCNHNGSILYAGGLQQTDQVTLGNHFQKHLNNPQNDR